MTMLGPGNDSDAFAGIEKAEGIVASSQTYGATVMDRAPQLRVLVRTGIGYDKIDVEAATARGIAVCNTPDGPTVSTAEHTVALILAACKRLPEAVARLREGEADLYSGHKAIELDGETLGLIGFGRIARRVAKAAQGLGMKVLAYDPVVADTDFFVERASTMNEVLASSQVVSVHVPLTPANKRMFDRDAFAQLRPGSVFVNTARGGLVDHDALIEALDSGRLSAVALDVTDPEPLPTDHPLLHRTDVMVTPHVASATTAGRLRIFQTALQQMLSALEGERPDHLVNHEVWDRRQLEVS